MSDVTDDKSPFSEAQDIMGQHSVRIEMETFIPMLDNIEAGVCQIEAIERDCSGDRFLLEAELILLRAVKGIIDLDATDVLVWLGDRRQSDIEMHETFSARRSALDEWYTKRNAKWSSLGYVPADFPEDEDAESND